MTRLALPCLLALCALACSKAPAEPTGTQRPSPTVSVAPLEYQVPGSWTLRERPRTGPRKAVYAIPRTGSDKEDAELTVAYFGTGSEGDPERRFREMYDLFDGNVGESAKRDAFDGDGTHVESFEVSGTFKSPLAPPAPGQKQAAIQMIKDDYRLLGAVVRTGDRGNWFFKLSGPDDTVKSARSGFESTLRSAR